MMVKRIMMILAVAMTTMAWVNKEDSPPLFKFREESHDFGKIVQGKPVVVELKFTNVGEQPLIISAVEPTCGCTVAKYTSIPVAKGKHGSITLSFSAHVVGMFNKAVTIKSNAKESVKVVYIKGEVVSALVP